MTNAESQIPVELLRELIDLDAKTGLMLWKARKPIHFVASKIARLSTYAITGTAFMQAPQPLRALMAAGT